MRFWVSANKLFFNKFNIFEYVNEKTLPLLRALISDHFLSVTISFALTLLLRLYLTGDWLEIDLCSYDLSW